MTTTTVMQWQRAVLCTDGRVVRVLEPGRHRVGRRDTVLHVDVRRRSTVVPGQEVLTADGVGLRVSALAQWRIADPVAYLTVTAEVEQALHAGVQLAVRDAVGAVTFEQVVEDRARLAAGLPEKTAAHVDGAGIEVLGVVVRDVMLPGELRKAALETLLARERGRAELEKARAETASLRSLANAARVLEDHPALLRLRTIQAAATPGTTLVLTENGQSLRTPAG